MKNFLYFLVALFIIFTGCIKKEKPAEIESGLDFKKPSSHKFPELAYNKLEYLISKGEPVLKEKQCLQTMETLNELAPVTNEIITSSEEEIKTLLEIANEVVQKTGYKNLSDYGIDLEKVTWAAGTYLKMLDLEKVLAIDETLPASRFLEENLRRRLNKQTLTRQDIELIHTKWEKFEKALDTMNELAEGMMKVQNSENL